MQIIIGCILIALMFATLIGGLCYAANRNHEADFPAHFIRCNECHEYFDPADLDQVIFHEVHKPIIVTAIRGAKVGDEVTSPPLTPDFKSPTSASSAPSAFQTQDPGLSAQH